MCDLPTTGLVRLSQIIGDSRAKPPIPPVIPVARATWWAGVKSGRFPAPIKLGQRAKGGDVLAFHQMLTGLDFVAAAKDLGRGRR
jgi:hypothetical protein